MAFVRAQGKTKIIYLPVTTSNVFSDGGIVALSSGYLIPATSTTAALSHIGVARKTITSVSTEYTSGGSIPVEVPVEKNVLWEAPVTSGLVAADVGLLVDLTDAGTINRGASTYDAAQVIKVISTTKGLFRLNLGGATGEIND